MMIVYDQGVDTHHLARAFPGRPARLHTFEPLPHLVAALGRSLAAAGLRVVGRDAAAGAAGGEGDPDAAEARVWGFGVGPPPWPRVAP
jgi:hypothetical protein